ncbi:MAG TPA: hypothetical protein VKR55_25010 [Bradyrhizobium sp.]|uniref:COG4223 family protein n=1 Tax=Bradyrhizobium sp. TaxID=376 RepID=UPI002CE61D7B|nr:hypothetical protein [Bradyrhizobium sp.]HLZ05396.1 hypothetical protein [Bradyrhizobium sp.]
MADDVLEDAGPAPDAGKVKREPPTIDLEATKVSEAASAEAGPAQSAPQPETGAPAEPPKDVSEETPTAEASAPISPWVIAPFSGAVAAALVIAVGWLLGWPAVQAPPAQPQVTHAAFDDLSKRVTGLESKAAKTPATDPAMTARLDTMEKSLATLRGDLDGLRAQSDKLAAAVDSARHAPAASGATAPAVDLSAINKRIDQIEQATRAQAAAIAQASKQASAAKDASAKAQDDLPLRRLVAAALLDVAVRHGDHYVEALATAKALAPNADALKPLDAFADKGIPTPPVLCRELLALVPKLSPQPGNATTGSGIIDRLQAGASKLVRVERTDAAGNDRSAVVARVTAAALRIDLADSRRELNALDPTDRAPAQGWLDKVAARDAALAASRQFAEDSMAALAKAAQ